MDYFSVTIQCAHVCACVMAPPLVLTSPLLSSVCLQSSGRAEQRRTVQGSWAYMSSLKTSRTRNKLLLFLLTNFPFLKTRKIVCLRQMSLEKTGKSRRRSVARLSISSTLHLHSDRFLSAREFQPAGRSVHITTNFRITASDSVSKYLTAQFSGYLSRTVHGDKFGFTHMMIHVISIYSRWFKMQLRCFTLTF